MGTSGTIFECLYSSLYRLLLTIEGTLTSCPYNSLITEVINIDFLPNSLLLGLGGFSMLIKLLLSMAPY